jgi:hypothetical protein
MALYIRKMKTFYLLLLNLCIHILFLISRRFVVSDFRYAETWLNMKNAVFWDVAPCRSSVNRRFGGTYRYHPQGRKIRVRGTSLSRWLQPHGATFQNTTFFIVTAVKTSVLHDSIFLVRYITSCITWILFLLSKRAFSWPLLPMQKNLDWNLRKEFLSLVVTIEFNICMSLISHTGRYLASTCMSCFVTAVIHHVMGGILHAEGRSLFDFLSKNL